MLEIRWCFVDLCVISLFVHVAPGAEIVTKYVCSGDSIPVFEIDKQDAVVSLYMNHEIHTLMATWHVENSTIISQIQDEYRGKIYFDEYRTIWIRNVNHWDEENYFIEYDIGTSPKKSELKIQVRVAPKKNCKPKIIHVDKILIASLEVEDCGIPVPSLQWLNYPGITNTSEPVINLPSGNEAGTYYACIKGPALECAKISTLSDYCSFYTIGGNDIPLSPGISDLKTAIFAMGSIVLLFGSVNVALAVITLIKNDLNWKAIIPSRKNDDLNWKAIISSRKNDDLNLKAIIPSRKNEILNLEKTMPLMDDRTLWNKNCGHLKWKDIMVLLNNDQMHGLNSYLETLKEEQTEPLLGSPIKRAYSIEEETDFMPVAKGRNIINIRETEM